MKKITAVIVTACALFSAAPVAFAQAAPDPVAMAAAQDLFASMNYRSVMVGLMQQISQGIGQSMRASAEAAIKNDARIPPAKKQQALDKMNAELPGVVKTMQATLNDPTLIDEMLAATVPIYARNFTADELVQMAAFYHTPVGTKMLALMPKLTAEGMQMGQQIVLRRIGPMMQKLTQGDKTTN
ncbi:DUF2059 domain-containing protein [Rugamonas apoptosis]|uniref:DUF2059 domain-containing protein n=1 Tax=Rugamonas apoptosis TaxID=2758570 RepID=A0A7W2IMS8_9BURK|nr:DUF2059 domain-containing protein [Rugamonas apoptosis]MBA5690003.1 DUF2059 domain-containing protein [Rugamonas apoptosis]